MWEGDVWVAVRAARSGADIVQSGFFEPLDTDLKGVVDPVTQVDRDAEAAIRSVIASHFPEDSILGEEEGGEDWRSKRVWIVDPLDGTVNYVHRIPHVAVSIALWDNGRPLVGVIIDVARNDEYVAVESEGASMNGTPIHVSETAQLGDSLVVTGDTISYDIEFENESDPGRVAVRFEANVTRCESQFLSSCRWRPRGTGASLTSDCYFYGEKEVKGWG